jgi:hypothetical protein
MAAFHFLGGKARWNGLNSRNLEWLHALQFAALNFGSGCVVLFESCCIPRPVAVD